MALDALRPIYLDVLMFILVLFLVAVSISSFLVRPVQAQVVQTQESSCKTGKTIFLQGEVACGNATSLNPAQTYYMEWWDPDTFLRQTSAQSTGNDTFTDLFDTDMYTTGLWTLKLIRVAGTKEEDATNFQLTGAALEFPHGLTLTLIVGVAIYIYMRKSLRDRHSHASLTRRSNGDAK